MSQHLQSIRGMHDVLPADSALWQWFESQVMAVVNGYGYQEIRMPLVEKTALFKRSIGEVTDIVEKEMYTFDDRNGDSLTLRPEGTASCVRACIQHGLLHNQQQRLWYQGPMFRHERPQKGRYRQFHQVGVETFGIPGPEVEAELIAMTARLWQLLGIHEVRLEINSLGSPEARQVYRERLVEYFQGYEADLDEDSRRRLKENPLRILDSKNPKLKNLIEAAPSLEDALDEASIQHFAQLRQMLDRMGIAYVVNPRLVRGLDYYTRTVFEWITESLGAQGTICAGGRYDGLVEQLGGKSVPAAGFAMGIERLLALIQSNGDIQPGGEPHAYVVLVGGPEVLEQGYAMTEQIRASVPGLRLQVNLGGGSIKSQMKKADKRGARVALIIGDDELQAGTVSFKPLRKADGEQQILHLKDLFPALEKLV